MGLGVKTYLAVFGALWFGPLSAWAHHSVAANFDADNRQEITGVVSAFHLRNPHSQLEVDVAEADGTTSRWLVEWGTRNDLIRRGVDVDRIKVGDELRISLIMSRRLEHVGYFQSAVLPDGSTIRDCGYAAFRDALVNSEKLECDRGTDSK